MDTSLHRSVRSAPRRVAALALLLPAVFSLAAEEPATFVAEDIAPHRSEEVAPQAPPQEPPASTAEEPQPAPSADIAPRPASEIDAHVSAGTAPHSTTPLPPRDAAPPPGSDAATTHALSPATDHRSARRLANPVEPLSNGLRLSMTQPEIFGAFGDPTDRTYDSRTFGYPAFSVQCGGADSRIWRVRLRQGVRLSSGIGVGAARAEVERIFGRSSLVNVGQYQLTFSYDGPRLAEIKIEPAKGDFVDWREAAKAEGKDTAAQSIVGTWHGAGDTRGAIELRDDGSYAWSGREAGRYRRQGEIVEFTGALAAWNGGRATLSAHGNALEFAWTNPDGSKQYFVFVR